MQQPSPPRSSFPPPRPDAVARGVRQERRWTPAGAVALVVLVVVVGGYVAAAALAGPSGAPHTVGGVVTIRPARMWQLAGASGAAAARFTRGSGTLDVFTGPAPDDVRALAQTYVEGSLDPHSSRLTVTPPTEWQAVSLGGLTGIRLGYIGVFDQSRVPIEGEVTAAVTAAGAGVVFDGWAPQGQLRFVLGDLRDMVSEARFR